MESQHSGAEPAVATTDPESGTAAERELTNTARKEKSKLAQVNLL